MGEMKASRDINVAACLQSMIAEEKKGSKHFVMMD
jgi:hypothetical protein